MDPNNSNEQKYPSVYFAYDIALKSYELAMKRSDTADDSIDKLRTFVTTINLAFIAWIIPKVNATALLNQWFILGLVVFVCIIVLTIVAKSTSTIILLDPRNIYQNSLHLSEWEFKRSIVFYAGDHYEKNIKMVARKDNLVLLIFTLFLFQSGIFGYWLVRSLH